VAGAAVAESVAGDDGFVSLQTDITFGQFKQSLKTWMFG